MGLATITVTLNVAPLFTVTVDYAAVDGTAVAGDDYTIANGRLIFAPGITGQTLNVTVLDDTVLDGDKTLMLQLTAVTNASLAQENVLLTLLDNEMRYQIFLPITIKPE